VQISQKIKSRSIPKNRDLFACNIP